METFEGMNPTQAEQLKAVRYRITTVHGKIAELTRELDELRELQREILYGGDE